MADHLLLLPPGGGVGGGSFSAGVSNLGNTAGTTGSVSGQVVLVGGANVTLSQSANGASATVTIVGGAGGAGYSAGVSNLGNTAGSTGITGTRLVLAGTDMVSLSQSTDANGGTVTIRATQTVQTQNLHNVTLSGNTAGVMAHVSSGTLTLAGGNNITLSQNGNAVSISAANAQTGISGVANSQTTYTSGTVSLGELGAITIRSTTGNQYQFSVNAQTNQAGSVYAEGNTFGTSSGTYDARTVSIAGDGIVSVAASNSGFRISATQSAQTQNVHNVTLSGNTAGVMAHISSGTMTLAGGNNVTLSQNGNAVTISAGAGGAGYSAGLSNVGNTVGDTGVVTARLVLAGGNNVTLSGSTNGGSMTVTVSGPNTVAQTNQAGSVYAIGNTTGTSSGTYDARTLSIRGDGIVSVAASDSGWRISATQSVQTQNVHNVTLSGNTAGVMAQISSGTMTLAGGNNITLSQNGNAVTISAANTVAQTNQSGNAYAAGNTFGTSSGTFDARTISIAGDGIVSVAASNSGWRISATQSVQTQNVHNVTLSGNTAGVMAHISSGTLTLAGGNNVTLSQNGNAVTISAGAGGAGMSAGLSNVGNTSGDTATVTGRLVLAGGNNITLSGSTNGGSMTITVSAPNLGAGAMSAGASNLGNTAGSTGITGTQLVLVGSGVVSLSQSTGANGGTVSILAPATSSLSATGAVSISTNGSTISIGAPNTAYVSHWPPNFQSTGLVAYTATASLFASAAATTTYTSPVFPIALEDAVSVNHARLPIQLSATTTITSQNFSYSLNQYLGLYTLNGASLSRANTFSNAIRISVATAANSTNASATFAMSYGSGTDLSSSTSLSTNNVFGNTSFWTSVSNTKLVPFASGPFSVPAGQYFGIYVYSQSTGNSNVMSLSQIGQEAAQTARTYGLIGKAVASTTGYGPLQGFVTFSLSNSSLPSVIETSAVTMSSNNATWVNRQPAIELMSVFHAV